MSALFACVLAFTADIRIVVDRPIYALAWHPDGKRLYAASDDCILEWPGSHWILLPPRARDSYYSETPERLEFNASGTKLLASDSYTESIVVVDLQQRVARRAEGAFYFTWWTGNDLASVQASLKNGDWSDPTFLEYKGKRVSLRGPWFFTAADPNGTVLLAKNTRNYLAPMALFRFDPNNLKLNRIRYHAGEYDSEHTAQDSIDWNERLGIGALGLTWDTGSTYAALWISKRSGVSSMPREGTHHLTSEPRWIGTHILASTKEFRESRKGKIGYGADIYRIQLFDPRSQKPKTLVEQNNRWTWRDGESEHYPPRGAQPTLESAAITADGRRLAWVSSKANKTEIVIRRLK
jgi:hypothetical protein